MKNIGKNDIELLMKSYLFAFNGKYNDCAHLIGKSATSDNSGAAP